MAAAALADRVVEVIADLGPLVGVSYRYGSGCIVGGSTVLTAAHVVAGAVSVVVRDPNRRQYAARMDPRFVGDPNGPGPDLALLEITDPAFAGDLPPVGLAAVDRDSPAGEPVERCHAVGYPWFAETPSPTAMRDTVDAVGMIPVLSKLKTGLLSVQVAITPKELPPEQITLGASEWSGMSGAPVFAAGRLLGVVTEHAPREGPSAIMAVPLTALQADPSHERRGPGVADPGAWWARLGVAGIGDLQRLPLPPPPRQPPAYRWTLREFGRTLHQRMPQLLGREQELSHVAAFATGSEGYRWLVAGAFTGKTALVYEAVAVGLPDEVDVVYYFLSRRASDASSGRFLAAVVPQLAYLCEVDAPEASLDQYHALWEQATARAAQTGRHLLLAVDGLDEDMHPPNSPSVASLLPALVGSHAHVLVTSRPRPDLPGDIPDGHPLTRVTPVHLDPFAGARQLAGLARTEIWNLTHGDDSDLAMDVLGALTAAEGALSLGDLVAVRSDGPGAPSAADTRHVRRVVEERAARSLERVGPVGQERYEFAHASLLEYAQTLPDLCDPEYRQRIHRWANRWRDAGWPAPDRAEGGTPRYLLDTYPATLTHDPVRLAHLVSDIGWTEAAVASAGVDRVLDDLRRAAAANPDTTAVAGVLAAVTGQAFDLRPPQPVDQPSYILRQLWIQAAELREDGLAESIRSRLQSRPGPSLVPRWTTRRASRALSGELGRHDGPVVAVAILAAGKVVTGGDDGRVLIWDLARPGTAPVELGCQDGVVRAVAVLMDGRVVTAAEDGRVLIWDPDRPGTTPTELARRGGPVEVMAVLPDGRVVTGDYGGRVMISDPAAPGDGPVELGRQGGPVRAVAVLANGTVITGAEDGRVLIWNPAAPFVRAGLGHHDGAVTAVAVLADGRVATSDYGGRVLIWKPISPGIASAESGRQGGPVRALAALPDGRVITGAEDGRLLIWDAAARAAAPAELGRHEGSVRAVAVLGDGRVVTGAEDGRVLIWDPAAATKLGRHDSPVEAVAVLADARVVTGGDDGRVLIWHRTDRAPTATELGRHDGPVEAVAVLADGRVVTGGDDGRVLIWDPDRPGTAPAGLGRHDNAVVAMAVLADGRVITGGYLDQRVLIWDPDRPGTAPAGLGRHDNAMEAVAVLADGRVVTGDYGGRVMIWDLAAPVATPTELGRHDGPVTAVAVLADGRVVTSALDRRVLIWDPAAPADAPAELDRHEGPVYALAVLADGRVVTGGDDRRVLIWDQATANAQVIQLSCSLRALATAPLGASRSTLAIAHPRGGLSLWSVTG